MSRYTYISSRMPRDMSYALYEIAKASADRVKGVQAKAAHPSTPEHERTSAQEWLRRNGHEVPSAGDERFYASSKHGGAGGHHPGGGSSRSQWESHLFDMLYDVDDANLTARKVGMKLAGVGAAGTGLAYLTGRARQASENRHTKLMPKEHRRSIAHDHRKENRQRLLSVPLAGASGGMLGHVFSRDDSDNMARTYGRTWPRNTRNRKILLGAGAATGISGIGSLIAGDVNAYRADRKVKAGRQLAAYQSRKAKVDSGV